MKDKFYDIQSLPGNGFLVFPLSMSRLSNAHSPENLYNFLEFIEKKLIHKSLDVILLYTNDLYLNTEEIASFTLRKKILNQVINHKTAINSLILKKNRFFPSAFHYIPWDYALLNAPDFNAERARLNSYVKSDSFFQEILKYDLAAVEREVTPSNMDFLIEELVVCHLILEREIPFPHHLSAGMQWRLMCYPGRPPISLAYLWQKNYLGNNKEVPKAFQAFARSFYDTEEKVLIDFKDVTFDHITAMN